MIAEHYCEIIMRKEGMEDGEGAMGDEATEKEEMLTELERKKLNECRQRREDESFREGG